MIIILEFKLKKIITNEQTVLLLRSVYYQDVNKIAKMIKEIMSVAYNGKWAGQLLDINFEEVGWL